MRNGREWYQHQYYGEENLEWGVWEQKIDECVLGHLGLLAENYWESQAAVVAAGSAEQIWIVSQMLAQAQGLHTDSQPPGEAMIERQNRQEVETAWPTVS